MASPPPQHTLSRALVVLIAVATGAIVANLYYAQPCCTRSRTPSTAGPALRPGSSRRRRSATRPGCCWSSRSATSTRAGRSSCGSSASPPPPWWPRRSRRTCGSSPLASAGGGRRVGGRPGDDPLRRRPGPRGAAGPRRGADHDRAPAGHPARPHGVGLRRAGHRWLARHLLALGRADALLRPRPLARPAGRGAAPAPHATATLVRTSLRLLVDRAGAAPPRLARRRRLRRLQRPVDHARVPALGQPLPLLLGGHRSLRPGRRGRDPRGQRRRQAGRLGPHHADDGRAPASSSPARSRCSGPAAPRWRR